MLPNSQKGNFIGAFANAIRASINSILVSYKPKKADSNSLNNKNI